MRHLCRWVVSFTAALAVLCAGASTANAWLEGVYDSCPGVAPGENTVADCAAEMSAIRSAGFLAVLNYSTASMSDADIATYANMASARGLTVIWDTPYTGGYTSVHHIDITKNLPATGGYYIADEPPPSDATSVNDFAQWPRALAPSKPVLTVSWGCSAAAVDYSQLLFAAGSRIASAGVDCYAAIGDGHTAGDVEPAFFEGYRNNATYGKPSWAVAQAFNWYNVVPPGPDIDHWPTFSELLKQRACAYATHNFMLLWFDAALIRKYNPNYWVNMVELEGTPLSAADCHD